MAATTTRLERPTAHLAVLVETQAYRPLMGSMPP
jgi:hypothetical protein